MIYMKKRLSPRSRLHYLLLIVSYDDCFAMLPYSDGLCIAINFDPEIAFRVPLTDLVTLFELSGGGVAEQLSH